MNMSEFTTSFGDKIEFVPGYREMFGRQHTPEETLARPDREPVRLTFKEFVKDRYLYGLVMDLLQQAGLPLNFGKTMELGAGEATFSRFLKASGCASSVVAVDIQRRNEGLTTQQFKKYNRRFEIRRRLAKLFKVTTRRTVSLRRATNSPLLKGRTTANSLLKNLYHRSRILQGLVSFRRQLARDMTQPVGAQSYYPAPESQFYNMKLNNPPEYDEYRITNVYKMTEKFNTIFAVLCLEYFDAQDILAKVAELLVDDGQFIVLVNSWWYPRNATEIVGDFPYVAQRLTRDDLERYFQEYHPGERQDTLTLYDYFSPQHPTLSQYADIGFRLGLTPIISNTLSTTGFTDKRAIVPPALLAECEDTALDEVLANIHRFRGDVTVMDLMSKFYFMVFRRKPRVAKTLDQALNPAGSNRP
jgi:SAM-dependent methyltransferase